MNVTSSDFKLDSRWFWTVVSIFWLFIAVSTYFGALAASASKGQEADYGFTALFHYGWILWIPFTWLVIRLSSRFKFHRPFIRFILQQFGLGILLALGQNLFNALFIYTAASTFYPDKRIDLYLLSYFLYSFHIHIIIYFLIVALHQGIRQMQRIQMQHMRTIQLESALVHFQNQVLKMQIRPHFLFNTHHSIISLIFQKKTQEAISMLTSLSDLLRRSLDITNKELITLAEEMEMVRLYLQIQEIRFGDRLKVHYDISSESLTKKIPVFILQPIVENAIKHGIEPVSASGKLVFCSRVKDTYLCISIGDDGRGMVPEKGREGIGIKNILSRLEIHFPDQFSFSMVPNKPKGTLVELKIPVIEC